MLNKEAIVKLLATNDNAIARALLVLNNNQTSTEQHAEVTINRNGEGFRPCHARMGTSMANFYQRNGYLSPKQIAYWRKPMACGNMKIAIYWRQLAEAADAKQKATLVTAARQQIVATTVKATDDVGNMMEELMVLEEEYGMYQDSDDFPKLVEMKKRIDMLNEEIARAYKGI